MSRYLCDYALDSEKYIQVGTTTSDGKVDAVDTSRHLKVGTYSTKNVTLSQAGNMTDIMGNNRHNGKQVILNDVDNLNDADGCGFKFNSVGHPGSNDPCIDFYINSAVVGYIDADDWHNL